jgi:hypothetical protein
MNEFTTWAEGGSILFDMLEEFSLVGKIVWDPISFIPS